MDENKIYRKLHAIESDIRADLTLEPTFKNDIKRLLENIWKLMSDVSKIKVENRQNPNLGFRKLEKYDTMIKGMFDMIEKELFMHQLKGF